MTWDESARLELAATFREKWRQALIVEGRLDQPITPIIILYIICEEIFQTSKFIKAQILAAFTRSHLADSMFPRMTSPVARFMIGWRVPRVKILLVNLAKNHNSRADVVATWHSLLVTMSSLLVTTFDYFFTVCSLPPWNERYLAAAWVARGGFLCAPGGRVLLRVVFRE